MYNPLSIPNPAPTPPPIPFLVDLYWFFWWVLILAILGVVAGITIHFMTTRHSRNRIGWYVGGISGVVAVIALFFVMLLPASLPTQ